MRALSARARRLSCFGGIAPPAGVVAAVDDAAPEDACGLEHPAPSPRKVARQTARLIMIVSSLRMTPAGGMCLAPRWARLVRIKGAYNSNERVVSGGQRDGCADL